ncbi:UNVERIFIED_ORG: hypothetical protein J2X79_003725 [Arthrobacter globiformis]|nr:hypothetical protein [Arthrobacter globiformis]
MCFPYSLSPKALHHFEAIHGLVSGREQNSDAPESLSWINAHSENSPLYESGANP